MHTCVMLEMKCSEVQSCIDVHLIEILFRKGYKGADRKHNLNKTNTKEQSYVDAHSYYICWWHACSNSDCACYRINNQLCQCKLQINTFVSHLCLFLFLFFLVVLCCWFFLVSIIMVSNKLCIHWNKTFIFLYVLSCLFSFFNKKKENTLNFVIDSKVKSQTCKCDLPVPQFIKISFNKYHIYTQNVSELTTSNA